MGNGMVEGDGMEGDVRESNISQESVFVGDERRFEFRLGFCEVLHWRHFDFFIYFFLSLY